MSQSTSPTSGFPALPPAAKIAVWLLAVSSLAGAIQLVAWTLGLPFNVLSHADGGSAVLMCVALVVLLAIMQRDRRDPAELGLVVDDDWSRQWGRGALLGMATYAAYCGLAWAFGVFELRTDGLTAYRLGAVVLAAGAAVLVAAAQSVMIGGYLLGILRQRHGRAAAVLVSSLFLALLARLQDPSQLLTAFGQREFAGMFLVGCLLGLLRLRCGSIIYPTGLLTGWIIVRRFLRKTHLLELDPLADLAPWIAPVGEPRQAPLAWALLFVACVGCWWALFRHGERRPATGQALSQSFKRTLPFSNILGLAPLDLWFGRLLDARCRIGWKYLPRLACVLALSAVNTVITLPERLLLPLLLRRRKIADPVFVVGVHRSGTTHLHNLLSLDRRFAAPRLFHTLNPLGMLFSGWIVTPLVGAFVTGTRFVDGVKINLMSPQEEEFAIAGMCRLSPYWGFTFPRRGSRYDRFIYPERLSEAERRLWRRKYRLFLRALTFYSGGRPLLKSPYNTARVAELRRMFPGAKFVHIVRRPADTWRSNERLGREQVALFQLHEAAAGDTYATRFPGHYRRQLDAFYREAAELPAGDVAEVRFEDLERDPVGEVRRIYARLGLEYEDAYDTRLRDYLQSLAGYRKNHHAPVTESLRREIASTLGPYPQRWGYANEANEAKAA